VITIGIDPHKATVTAVAVGADGQQLASARLRVTATMGAELLDWAAEWPQRRWAVEGASGLGRGVAQRLAAAGEVVVDVPALLAARARLLGSGNGRKTDPVDAASVAAVAQHNRRLHQVHPEDHSVVLRLLTERREDIVNQRTRTINQLHAVLRDLLPGGAPTGITATAATALLRTVRPATVADHHRPRPARTDWVSVGRAALLRTEQTQT
jgi:transposase